MLDPGFPRGGCQDLLALTYYFGLILAEDCIRMKKKSLGEGGGLVPCVF